LFRADTTFLANGLFRHMAPTKHSKYILRIQYYLKWD
jgi:hypothetical protein